MTKSVVEILNKARELISISERWCTEAMAENQSGMCVSPHSENACRWCSEGAVERSGGPANYEAKNRAIGILDACAKTIGFTNIIKLNDEAGHATVLKAFDCAILKAESKP